VRKDKLMRAFRLPSLPIAFAALACASSALASAPQWNTDKGQSRVTFAGTHAGDPFEGRFETWQANIRFDPKDLKSSRIIVVVATGTAKTGDSVQESSLQNGEWFDPENHPTATFASNDIRAEGGNRYTARGTLTMKGKAVPMTLPFTVDIDGRKAKAQGKLELDRVQLGLGLASDPNAEWVSRKIALSFSLSASR
jgi:polyisoprenoid-binding protein YceI